jgi:phage repressor protein C with HTH and peptisase S24 domain
VGVSKTWIYDILKGKPASVAILSAIADNTSTRLKWLVTGEGMPSAEWEKTTALISRLAIPAAGQARELQPTGRHMLFATELLEDLGVNVDDAGVISVPDSDMSPVINFADDVLIQLNQQRLFPGALYLIETDSGATIRRAFTADGGATWILVAERKSANQIPISDESPFRIFGRVRWIGHKL